MSTAVGSPLAGAWGAEGPSVTSGPVAGRSPGGCSLWLAGRLVEPGTAASDADGLAEAYEREGERMLAPLRGEFVVVAWNPRSRTGFIARDQLGGRPLHWARNANGLVFGAELRDVLDLLPSTPGADRVALIDWLVLGTTPVGRSFLEGVRRLPPGGILRIADGAVAEDRWWRPRYSGTRPGNPAELEERTLRAMDAAVARAAGDARRVGVMLSGGLDSAAVAAAAARLDAEEGWPRAYSGVFPGHPEIDESENIADVRRWHGLGGAQRVFSPGSPVRGALPYLRRWKVPVGSPNHFIWEPLFERAVADGVELMLDGEGGDEIFDVSAHLIADRLLRGRFLSAWSLTRRLTGVPPDLPALTLRHLLVRHGVKGATPLWAQRLARRRRAVRGYAPDWLEPGDAQAYVETSNPWAWKEFSGPRWWRHQADILTNLRERIDAHGYVRRRTEQLGLESRHPFMHDLDLVELALTLPPEPRFDREHDRVLLRRALRGRLPDSVRLRSRKPRFSNVLGDAMAGADGASLRELVGRQDALISEFVRPDVVAAQVLHGAPGDYPGGRHAHHVLLWRLGIAEIWLRSLADEGFLDGLAARLPEPSAAVFQEV